MNKPLLISNNFPDHQLVRIDSNTLSLSFQQWRSGEFVLYSIYLKSDKNVRSFAPMAQRMIKDGNILIEDLTNNQDKNKVPLLDIFFSSPWTIFLRGLGIIIGFAILLLPFLAFIVEFLYWLKLQKWESRYYQKYFDYLSGNTFLTTDSNFNIEFTKDLFSKNKKNYLRKPLMMAKNSGFWKNIAIPPVPGDVSFMRSWRSALLFVIILMVLASCGVSIILGLWLS